VDDRHRDLTPRHVADTEIIMPMRGSANRAPPHEVRPGRALSAFIRLIVVTNKKAQPRHGTR
jgi:hypothetical protein